MRNSIIKPLFFLIIPCAFILMSCSSEKEVDLRPRQTGTPLEDQGTPSVAMTHDKINYSMKIVPESGFRNTVFRVVPSNFRLSGARIQWTLNGYLVPGADGVQFKPEDAGKGDTIQAKAIVDKTEVLSNSVVIRNSQPEIISVRLLPEVFRTGDRLYVDVSGSDQDGDKLTISYEWSKNGKPAGSSKYIDSTPKRGDKVLAKITPYDGEDYGQPVIIRREIQNMPTTIIENNEFSFDGKTFTYQVKAVDPDDDKLAYSLKSDVKGMTINSETGVITWPVPEKFTGTAQMTVSVSDGFSGDATQELSFNLSLVDQKVSQEQ